MRSEDLEAQATAHQLVHCVLEADSDGLTNTLETVVDQPTDELKPYVREVVAELINVATSAVRNSAGPLQAKAAFAVDLRDDTNDQVAIDELEPPVRATIRAMLADLNGSPEDASFQLDLAVRGIDRRTGLDTVRRALTMTIGLLHWSEQSDPMEGVLNPELTPADEAELLEANEVDVIEQRTELDPDDHIVPEVGDLPEADALEQRRELPDEDER